MTFVRGQNHDACPGNCEKTGNGSGKSLLFATSIANLLLGAPPLSNKKKAVKELIGKKSSVTLRCTVDEKEYEIIQSFSGYTILENGVDLKVRTKPLQEQFIQKLFPLREIEFYTYGYLASQRSFLMQQDTDSNRLEHFTSMFRLDNYAAMRKHFAQKLSLVKDAEVKLSVLEQSVLSLKKKLKDAEAIFNVESLSTARADYEKLDSEISVLSKQEYKLMTLQQTLKTLLTIEKELDALRSRYTDSRSPKELLAWSKAQREIVRQTDKHKSLLKSYLKSVNGLNAQLERISLPPEDEKTLKQNRKSLIQTIDELTEELKVLEERRSMFRSLSRKGKALLEQLKSYDVDYKKYRDDRDYDHEILQCRTNLKLKTLLTSDDTCPTCLSAVDKNNIKNIVVLAEKQLPTLLDKKKIQDIVIEVRKLSADVKRLRYDEADFNAKTKTLKSSENRLAEVESKIKVHNEHSRISEMLLSIEEPEAPKIKPESDLTHDQLEAQVDLCTDILRHLSGKQKLLENHPEITCKTVSKVKTQLDDCCLQLKNIEQKLTTKKKESSVLATEIEKHAVAQSEVNLYRAEYNDTVVKIKKLRPLLADKDILATLITAYGTKGLKTVVANEICGLLERNLNEYSDLIFMEPFKFSVQASDTGLSIMVDRGNNIVSDVRHLSGAESNCFRLLFVFALLPMIPDSRRLNFIILDEPTSLMHTVTRQVFLDRYVPALMEIVPHIYIITPNEEHIQDSSAWLVVKRDGESKLITV